jgi:hypothetical protein
MSARDFMMGHPAAALAVQLLEGFPDRKPVAILPLPWPPVQGHTPARDAAKTQEHDAKHAPKPVPKEPPYQPEGFDFQYVDHKGRTGEVIQKRPVWPFPDPVESESVITPRAPSKASGVPEGATHWHPGSPLYFRRGQNGIREAFVDGRWKENDLGFSNDTLDEPWRAYVRLSSKPATA